VKRSTQIMLVQGSVSYVHGWLWALVSNARIAEWCERVCVTSAIVLGLTVFMFPLISSVVDE